MKKNGPIVIILMLALSFVCIVLVLAAIVGGGLLYAASSEGELITSSSKLDPEATEMEVLAVATDYAATGDLTSARSRLDTLDLPNSEQYISFLVDRYLQENRGPDDVDTKNLFLLADALGATTPSMVAALAPPTLPPPPPTLLPPATPLPPTDTPTPIPVDTPTVAPIEAAEVEAPVEEEPTPTETPAPVPTDTPVPATPIPAPPTNTPEPTPIPEPTQPAIDFVVAEAYLIRNPTYNSCPGSHQIFVTVVDAGGAPLDGVTVQDTFRAVPPKITGEKGPGKLEYDLWNNGFSLEITSKVDGAPATSEMTPKMSSWDEDIPNEWLVEANYCLDLNDCLQRKANNQLCRGHYSYNVTFRRTY